MPETGVSLQENSSMAEQEFAPTPEQQRAIATGCMAKALASLVSEGGLTVDQKSQLRNEIASLQANIAQAISLIKNKRARMSQQKDKLNQESIEIGQSKSNFSKFYSLAARAVTNCGDAAKAAQDAKTGIDMVFSRQTEIQYRVSLLSSLDASLSGTLSDLNSSMDVLDKMVLAIS